MSLYEEAVQYYNIAAQLFREESLVNPGLSSVYHNLGITLEKMGKLTEALEYYNQALKMREKLYGPNHPKVANTLVQLAIWHHLHGDHLHGDHLHGDHLHGDKSAGKKYAQRACSIYSRTHGDNHPWTVEAREMC
jgi:tetratricopeptide (TPR) repeat protein